jgi:putative transposase
MRSQRPRLRTFDYRGRYRYFLTFCTHARQRRFVSADVVDPVHEQIVQAATAHEFSIPAYVFMPDHLHLLVEGLSEASDLKAFVKLAKQKSGHAFSGARGDRLWQPSYYDHALRDDESSLPVMWYVLMNPVRAGLVSQCEDYPFLGSMTHSIAEIREACAELPWVREA